MIIDFRIKKPTLEPLIVNNEQVAQTTSYKYLGVTIDNKLNWHSHTSLIHKKAHKRLFFLRKLKSFGIDNKLIELFYHATIESIIVFCITSWGGNIRICDQTKFDRLIKKAGKIFKSNPPPFEILHRTISLKKIQTICSDPKHPLAPQIRLSSRRNRPLFLRTNTERYRSSFLPSAIKLL